MKRLGVLFSTVCVLAFVSGCGVEKEKLHGKWVVEDGPSSIPKGTVWEFTPDGKLLWASHLNASFVTKEGLAWSVSGKVLTTRMNGNEGKARIQELSDDKLVLKDDAHPKDVVLKKVK